MQRWVQFPHPPYHSLILIMPLPAFLEGSLTQPWGWGQYWEGHSTDEELRLEPVCPCPELQKLAAGFGALVFLTSRPMYLMVSLFYLRCNWIPNDIKIPTVSQNKNLLLTRRLSAVPAQGFRVLQRMDKKHNLFSKNDKENEGAALVGWQDHLLAWSEVRSPFSYPSSDGQWH